MQAANELGEALKASPVVQDYLRASAAADGEAEFKRMETNLHQTYDLLIQRQEAGGALSPYEINQFYKMREQVINHPLYQQREAAQRAMQAVFEQAGSTLSSVLTVDFLNLTR